VSGPDRSSDSSDKPGGIERAFWSSCRFTAFMRGSASLRFPSIDGRHSGWPMEHDQGAGAAFELFTAALAMKHANPLDPFEFEPADSGCLHDGFPLQLPHAGGFAIVSSFGPISAGRTLNFAIAPDSGLAKDQRSGARSRFPATLR